METLVKKIALISAQLGVVGKSRENSAQGFKFRGYDDIINSISPLLNEHSVSIIPTIKKFKQSFEETKNGSTWERVITTIEYTFTDGVNSIVATTIGCGFDGGDKASAKAQTQAFKTALAQVFHIPTDETSADKETDATSQPAGRKLRSAQVVATVDTSDEVAEPAKSKRKRTLSATEDEPKDDVSLKVRTRASVPANDAKLSSDEVAAVAEQFVSDNPQLSEKPAEIVAETAEIEQVVAEPITPVQVDVEEVKTPVSKRTRAKIEVPADEFAVEEQVVSETAKDDNDKNDIFNNILAQLG